uniref:Uncharacterized protein n=1 Tax=Leersia perrieri TaxID=77586 RepID=A0A0D9WVF4_9ORYZ
MPADADSCTRGDENGLHLHELIGGTGVEHHRGEEEHWRTIFLGATVAAASTPPPDMKTSKNWDRHHHLAKPRGPSEGRKTAVSPGGGRNACFRLSQR